MAGYFLTPSTGSIDSPSPNYFLLYFHLQKPPKTRKVESIIYGGPILHPSEPCARQDVNDNLLKIASVIPKGLKCPLNSKIPEFILDQVAGWEQPNGICFDKVTPNVHPPPRRRHFLIAHHSSSTCTLPPANCLAQDSLPSRALHGRCAH